MAMVSSRFRRRELILQPPVIWLNRGQVVGGKGIVEREGWLEGEPRGQKEPGAACLKRPGLERTGSDGRDFAL